MPTSGPLAKPAQTPAFWRRRYGARGIARVESQRKGIHGTAPTVWAAGAGQAKIVYGLAGDHDTMRFRFPLRDPNYKKLVATRGLAATIGLGRHPASTDRLRRTRPSPPSVVGRSSH